MSDLVELEQQIIVWAEEKGIFDNSTPFYQFVKFTEEAVELKTEIENVSQIIEKQNMCGYFLDVTEYEKYLNEAKTKLKLELGDVLVTLALLAKMHDTSFAECMQLAYDKISKRTGTMVDGLFVKDGD